MVARTQDAIIDFAPEIQKSKLNLWPKPGPDFELMKRIKQISNNTASVERQRFEQTLEYFARYGKEYGFDPLMLAAQGYQESQLRQEARSRGGAIGVMQLLPATGRALQVGDIRVLEPNIHAGAKYLDQLLTRVAD